MKAAPSPQHVLNTTGGPRRVDVLCEAMRDAVEVSVAVAFVHMSGLHLLLAALKTAPTTCVRVLTSTYPTTRICRENDGSRVGRRLSSPGVMDPADRHNGQEPSTRREVTGPAPSTRRSPVALFDFFSGAGGTAEGMRQAGAEVVAAIEYDVDAAATYALNHPNARVFAKDIAAVTVNDLRPLVRRARAAGQRVLFCACAPCQPFSKQRSKRLARRNSRDARYYILREFLRFAEDFEPDFVFCENVPEAEHWEGTRGHPIRELVSFLHGVGYTTRSEVVDCRDYGVPQRRARWVLLGSRDVAVSWPRRTHGPGRGRAWVTVGEALRGLPPLHAGQASPTDPVHCAANLSPINLARIQATPVGGSRRDWPEELVLACHRGLDHSYTDVYGRLRDDEPASAMTTRCNSLSNGRFGHPTQHRAISIREAACLQTFPRTYRFVGVQMSMARQVGNAVPVELARRFGGAIVRVARGS